MTSTSDSAGRWVVSNVPTGRIRIQAQAPGFQQTVRDANYDANGASTYSFALNVGATAETVEVIGGPISGRNYSELQQMPKKVPQQNFPSGNVLDLQKRVAGVLPVAIDVPRAGTSFSFVRPLVLDEETKVTFSYKSR